MRRQPGSEPRVSIRIEEETDHIFEAKFSSDQSQNRLYSFKDSFKHEEVKKIEVTGFT